MHPLYVTNDNPVFLQLSSTQDLKMALERVCEEVKNDAIKVLDQRLEQRARKLLNLVIRQDKEEIEKLLDTVTLIALKEFLTFRGGVTRYAYDDEYISGTALQIALQDVRARDEIAEFIEFYLRKLPDGERLIKQQTEELQDSYKITHRRDLYLPLYKYLSVQERKEVKKTPAKLSSSLSQPSLGPELDELSKDLFDYVHYGKTKELEELLESSSTLLRKELLTHRTSVIDGYLQHKRFGTAYQLACHLALGEEDKNGTKYRDAVKLLESYIKKLPKGELILKAQQLQRFVVHGNLTEVYNILKSSSPEELKELLTHRELVQDYSGRIILATLYQLTLGRLDVSCKRFPTGGMAELIEMYFRMLPNGELLMIQQEMQQFPEKYQTEKKLKQQLDSKALHEVVKAILDTKDEDLYSPRDHRLRFNFDYREKHEHCKEPLDKFRGYLNSQNVIIYGIHFNIHLLIEALRIYKETVKRMLDTHTFKGKNLDIILKKVIGLLQTCLPACDAQALCVSNEFKSRRLHARNGVPFYPRMPDPHVSCKLGRDAVILDGVFSLAHAWEKPYEQLEAISRTIEFLEKYAAEKESSLQARLQKNVKMTKQYRTVFYAHQLVDSFIERVAAMDWSADIVKLYREVKLQLAVYLKSGKDLADVYDKKTLTLLRSIAENRILKIELDAQQILHSYQIDPVFHPPENATVTDFFKNPRIRFSKEKTARDIYVLIKTKHLQAEGEFYKYAHNHGKKMRAYTAEENDTFKVFAKVIEEPGFQLQSLGSNEEKSVVTESKETEAVKFLNLFR